MSVYTTQLRHIVISLTDDMPITTKLRDRVENARTQIFDFDYPIWEESERKNLETKIINHYLMEEIGLETYELWQHYLEVKLNDIMPYYVDKYNSIYPYVGKLYINKDYHSHNTNENHLGRNDDYLQNVTGNVNSTEDLARGDLYNENSTGNISSVVDSTKNTTNNGTKDTTGNTKTDETYGMTGSENGGYTNVETKDRDTEETTNASSHSTRTDDLSEKTTNDLTHSILNDNTTVTYGHTINENGNHSGNCSNSNNQLSIHSDLPQSSLHVVNEPVSGTAAGNSVYPITQKAFGYDYATYSDQTQSFGSSNERGDEHKDTQHSGEDVTDRTATEKDTGTVIKENTGTQDNDGWTHNQVIGTDNENNSLTNTNNKNTSEDYTKGNVGTSSGNETVNSNEDIVGNETDKTDTINATNSNRSINQNIGSNTDSVSNSNSQRDISQNSNSVDDYTILGLDGKSYSELIGKYQEFITNIEMDIINDLKSLFMSIY